MQTSFVWCAALAAMLLGTSIARGNDVPVSGAEALPKGPFERPLAVSGYGVGWAGAYTAAGVGGRLRWEMVPGRFGVELLAEHLAVEGAGGFRHDHPIGFNLYVPFAASRRVRVRALAGACTVFSFVEPEHAGAPRADDILFGVHGGAGVEIALHERVSWYLEAQMIGYLAHERTGQRWTGSVGSSERPIAVFQPTTGLAIHLGK